MRFFFQLKRLKRLGCLKRSRRLKRLGFFSDRPPNRLRPAFFGFDRFFFAALWRIGARRGPWPRLFASCGFSFLAHWSVRKLRLFVLHGPSMELPLLSRLFPFVA
jgi:hypothetical protein